MRYQSDQRTKQTPYERTRGCRYESALGPFGEVVMAKIADGDKMRAGKWDTMPPENNSNDFGGFGIN